MAANVEKDISVYIFSNKEFLNFILFKLFL